MEISLSDIINDLWDRLVVRVFNHDSWSSTGKRASARLGVLRLGLMMGGSRERASAPLGVLRLPWACFGSLGGASARLGVLRLGSPRLSSFGFILLRMP